MSTLLRVNPNLENSTSSEDEVRVASDSKLWSFVPERPPRRVPLFIPYDQAYYWTREWQDGIRRSVADLEAGNYVDYDSDEPDAFMQRFVGDED